MPTTPLNQRPTPETDEFVKPRQHGTCVRHKDVHEVTCFARSLEQRLAAAVEALKKRIDECPNCGGCGFTTHTESGHGCDGTEESCARNCPVPVEVQDPCEMCYCDRETLAEIEAHK